ncbi:MAG: hypothetical protein ACRDRN_26760 [Sciscionella sp.]
MANTQHRRPALSAATKPARWATPVALGVVVATVTVDGYTPSRWSVSPPGPTMGM